MKVFLSVALVVASGAVVSLQEREIPKDSAFIAISGCTKGRTFIVGPRSEHQPGSLEIAPGRRFRLSGPKTLLDEIKTREGMMITVSGLVRKAQLAAPGGVSLAGGRVRVGGALPRDPGRLNEPVYNEVVIDVESWRGLPESCPAR